MDPRSPTKTVCDIQCLYMEGLRKSQKLKLPPGRPTKALYLKKFQEMMLPFVDLSGAMVDQGLPDGNKSEQCKRSGMPIQHTTTPYITRPDPLSNKSGATSSCEEDAELKDEVHSQLTKEGKNSSMKLNMLTSDEHHSIFGVAETSIHGKTTPKIQGALFPTNLMAPSSKQYRAASHSQIKMKPVKRLQSSKKQSVGTGRAYAKIYKFLKTMPHKHLQGKLVPPNKPKKPPFPNSSTGHAIRKQLKIKGSAKCVETSEKIVMIEPPKNCFSVHGKIKRTVLSSEANSSTKHYRKSVPRLQEHNSSGNSEDSPKSCKTNKSSQCESAPPSKDAPVESVFLSGDESHIKQKPLVDISPGYCDDTVMPLAHKVEIEAKIEEHHVDKIVPEKLTDFHRNRLESSQNGISKASLETSCESPDDERCKLSLVGSAEYPQENISGNPINASLQKEQDGGSCSGNAKSVEKYEENSICSDERSDQHAADGHAQGDGADQASCDMQSVSLQQKSETIIMDSNPRGLEDCQVAAPTSNISVLENTAKNEQVLSIPGANVICASSPMLPCHTVNNAKPGNVSATNEDDNAHPVKRTENETFHSCNIDDKTKQSTLNLEQDHLHVTPDLTLDMSARHDTNRKPALEVAQDIVNEHVPSKHMPDVDLASSLSIMAPEKKHDVHSSIAKALKVARQRILESPRYRSENHAQDRPQNIPACEPNEDVKAILEDVLDHLDENATNDYFKYEKHLLPSVLHTNLQRDTCNDGDVYPVVQYLVDKVVEDVTATCTNTTSMQESPQNDNSKEFNREHSSHSRLHDSTENSITEELDSASNIGQMSQLHTDTCNDGDVYPVVQYLVDKVVEDVTATCTNTTSMQESPQNDNSKEFNREHSSHSRLHDSTENSITEELDSASNIGQMSQLHTDKLGLSEEDSNDGLHIDEDCHSMVDSVTSRGNWKLNMASRLQICTGNKRTFVRRRHRKRGKFKLTMPAKRRTATIDDRKVPKLRLVSTDSNTTKEKADGSDDSESIKAFVIKPFCQTTPEMNNETTDTTGNDKKKKRDMHTQLSNDNSVVRDRKKRLYPRRDTIVYTSDIPALTKPEENAESPTSCGKLTKRRRKSLTGDVGKSEAAARDEQHTQSVDIEAEFTDNRLSMEFSKHNWILEKYKSELQSPDISATPSEPLQFPTAEKKPKRKRKTAVETANDIQDDKQSGRTKKTKRPKKKSNPTFQTKENNARSENSELSQSCSPDNETAKESETSGTLKILEVVSLAGFLQDENDTLSVSKGTGPDLINTSDNDKLDSTKAISTNDLSTSTTHDQMCNEFEVLTHADISTNDPEDLSVKPSMKEERDEEMQPLDLSVKSTSALDLRKTDSQRDTTKASYNCFNVKSLNSYKTEPINTPHGEHSGQNLSTETLPLCSSAPPSSAFKCDREVQVERAKSNPAQPASDDPPRATPTSIENPANPLSRISHVKGPQPNLSAQVQTSSMQLLVNREAPLLDDDAASSSADRNMVTPPDKIITHNSAVNSLGTQSIPNHRSQTSPVFQSTHTLISPASLVTQHISSQKTPASSGVQQCNQRVPLLPGLEQVSLKRTSSGGQYISDQSSMNISPPTSSTQDSPRPYAPRFRHSVSREPNLMHHAVQAPNPLFSSAASLPLQHVKHSVSGHASNGIPSILTSMHAVREPFLGASFLQTSNMLRGNGNHSTAVNDSRAILCPTSLRPQLHSASNAVQKAESTHFPKTIVNTTQCETSYSNLAFGAPVARRHQSTLVPQENNMPPRYNIEGISTLPHAQRHPAQSSLFRMSGVEPSHRQDAVAAQIQVPYTLTERRQTGASPTVDKPIHGASGIPIPGIPSPGPNIAMPQYTKTIRRNDNTYQQVPVTRPVPKSGSQAVSVQTKEGTVIMPLGHINCEGCSKRANFLCSGCKRVAYCSPNCQFIAWKTHKNRCG